MSRLVPFAIGFALMVAFVPGWAGLATTPRWDVGAVIAFALFCTVTARGMSAAHWLGLVLVAWLIASLAWSSSPDSGIDQALKLMVVVAAFAWGGTLDEIDLRLLVAGAMVGIGMSSWVAIEQWMGALPWVETASAGTPAGLFFNANRLAEAVVLVLAASIATRLWSAFPILLPSLLLPQSRAAWLAAGVVLAIVIWRRLRIGDRFILASIALMLLALAGMTAEIWRTANFGPAGIAQRIAMWSFVAEHFSVLGRGLGSFTVDGPMLTGPIPGAAGLVGITKAEHPHNEFLWLAYEGGLPALGLFGAFAVCCWRSAADQARYVLVALGIIACFAMPFHDPASILLAAAVAGFAARRRDRVRAATDARRDPLRAWVEQECERGAERGTPQGIGAALSVRAAVS